MGIAYRYDVYGVVQHSFQPASDSIESQLVCQTPAHTIASEALKVVVCLLRLIRVPHVCFVSTWEM